MIRAAAGPRLVAARLSVSEDSGTVTLSLKPIPQSGPGSGPQMPAAAPSGNGGASTQQPAGQSAVCATPAETGFSASQTAARPTSASVADSPHPGFESAAFPQPEAAAAPDGAVATLRTKRDRDTAPPVCRFHRHQLPVLSLSRFKINLVWLVVSALALHTTEAREWCCHGLRRQQCHP